MFQRTETIQSKNLFHQKHLELKKVIPYSCDMDEDCLITDTEEKNNSDSKPDVLSFNLSSRLASPNSSQKDFYRKPGW